jgi:hypothetical protein
MQPPMQSPMQQPYGQGRLRTSFGMPPPPPPFI